MEGMKIKSGQKWQGRKDGTPVTITVNRVSKTSVFWHFPQGGPEQKLDRLAFLARFSPL